MSPPVAARPLDHLVLPVVSLEVARERLQGMGFIAAPTGTHPTGTQNACVHFEDGAYLEPLAIGDDQAYSNAVRDNNAFVVRDRAYRFRNGEDGFSAVVMGSTDADADHAAFERAGMSGGARFDFSRPFLTPDGQEDIASFRLAFAADWRAPDLFFFTCERAKVPDVDRSALTDHPNRATGITRVVLGEDEPAAFRALLAEITGSEPVDDADDGLHFAAGTATLSVVTPAVLEQDFAMDPADQRGLRAVAIVLATRRLDTAASILDQAQIEFRRIAERLVVPPAPGQGAAIVFEDAP